MKALADYREKFFEDWYQFDNTLFFILVCVLYFVMFLLKRMFILDSIAAFEILQERGEMWVFDLFFGFKYLSVPFFLAWKFTLTAFIIWVGSFMFGYKIYYRDLWRWVMFAELIFIVPEFLKFLWFLLVQNDPTYQEIVAFYPLSLINLVDAEAIHPRYHYPFKAFNVFELIYWFVLMVGVFFLSRKKWHISVYVVTSSYILFFLLWLIYYMIIYK